MRQAGRYQPEYRKIRESYSLMDIVHTPEVCAEVTLLPVRQLDVDAAILFSDIMTPLEAMGIDFEIREGIGPCIDRPLSDASDIARLCDASFEEALPYVAETIAGLRRELKVPLIGFCGAPYTLSCYLVEGKPSKHYMRVKGLMYGDPDAWHTLMGRLSSAMADYLCFQANAGAQALQVFDSWVGNLGIRDYEDYVMPHMTSLFAAVRERTDVPLLHFGVGTGHLLERMQAAGGDVIGLDWRTSIPDARRRLGPGTALQGNLDPGLLLAPRDTLHERARRVLADMDGDGYIFNLGHGVLPGVEVETLQALTALVRSTGVDAP